MIGHASVEDGAILPSRDYFVWVDNFSILFRYIEREPKH